MKAITICQPYAELIASRVKLVENRTWPTRHRGPLAIHAGKSHDWLDPDDDPRKYTFGAIVAVATLADCVRLADLPNHLKGHAHAFGPWCWILSHVDRVPGPIPARGAQGLWEWTR